MTILQIEMPEAEVAILDARAHAQGYANGAAYLASVAHHLALENQEYGVEDNPSPGQLKREERLLLETLDDEMIEVTPEVWATFRARMESIIDGSQP